MKKSYFLSLLFLLIFVSTNAQDVGCVRIIARTPLPICNPGQSTTLEAVPPSNLTPRLTTGYDVSPIPFNWRNITRDDVATNITTDDTWSELINMKGSKPENFYFCFFKLFSGKRFVFSKLDNHNFSCLRFKYEFLQSKAILQVFNTVKTPCKLGYYLVI